LDTHALEHAYAACRAIARREAKNFYYAFVALPLARRNAICAIYAFMRHADDLADDESLSREERRRRLDAWLADWRGVCHGGDSSNPVFLAVRDATERFGIPLDLLDELVAGTTMDIKSDVADAPDTYATFADLYRYCYLVASVVGLVCIRIFGYILRDVAEDAARHRVYLPLEDLAAHGVPLDSLLHREPGAVPTENERTLLAEIALRADNYYRSAQLLLPMIDPESRPALWVLVAIYQGLLKRIERANYDVFSRRATMPMPEKLGILAVGLARMGWARVAR
jgi:phytoene synthase